MEGFIAIARPSATERCAFCHDALGEGWELCSGCNTRLHAECRAQAVECPTLGCRWSIRPQWAARGRRPRPAFRLALARLASRDQLVFEAPSVRGDAVADLLGPSASLVLHALLSPIVLVVFTVAFLAVFVPAHWAGTLLRRRSLSDGVRDRARGLATRFAFEAVAAPFVALALVGLASSVASATIEPDAAPLVAALLLSALTPPALGWFGTE